MSPQMPEGCCCHPPVRISCDVGAVPHYASELMASSAVQAAQAELNNAVAEFTANQPASGTDADKTQRRRIVDAAQKVMHAVRDPADEWVDMTGQIAAIAVNRLFWEWGVFEKIPLEGSISYSELAEAVGAEIPLISME